MNTAQGSETQCLHQTGDFAERALGDAFHVHRRSVAHDRRASTLEHVDLHTFDVNLERAHRAIESNRVECHDLNFATAERQLLRTEILRLARLEARESSGATDADRKHFHLGRQAIQGCALAQLGAKLGVRFECGHAAARHRRKVDRMVADVRSDVDDQFVMPYP